jgi:sulfoxide reductase heme-binding subunit YedZ
MRRVRPTVHLVALGLGAWTLLLPTGAGGPAGGNGLDRTLWFGLWATVSLYLALLPGPLAAVFPALPGRGAALHARRALGIDAAVFSGLHAWFGFFGWVGGVEGFGLWSWDYQLSLLLGGVALALLAALALTSSDRAVALLGRGWKRLHRLVYLAGLLVVAHASIITIHVLNLGTGLVVWFGALALLLLLEFLRLRARATPRQGVAAAGVLVALLCVLYWSTFLVSHHRH